MAPPSTVEIIELPSSAPAAGRQPPGPPGPRRPKLYVATPCFGCQLTVPYLASLMGLQAQCAARGVELHMDHVGNESLVERARNLMAAKFLESDCTHMLFIDADIAFRPDTVFRLLDSGKDVVTAVYAKKAFDWCQVRDKLAAGCEEPVHQTGLDFNINLAGASQTAEAGFVRVLDSATGFMMISRAAMQRMADHYREELLSKNDVQGQPVDKYVALFACMIDPVSRRFLSEDYSFCRRYQQLGGEIWADVVSPLVHVGTAQFPGDLRRRLGDGSAGHAEMAATTASIGPGSATP